ncbi:MAG: FMN-binding protein [Paludibacter sp.]|nr:FMN-binding protein [Paludibacter sp.]
MRILTIFFSLLVQSQLWATSQFNLEKALKTELNRQFKSKSFTISVINLPDNIVVQGKFYKIDVSEDHKLKYIYIGRINTTRVTIQANDTDDYLDYFILYDSLKTVRLVKIYKFNSSHGEGVTSQGWLKQFIGHNTQKSLNVGKNIDAIAGATISVNKLTFDIQSKTRILNDLRAK